MLRYLLYPAFGLTVLGGYAATASQATDLTSTNVRRGTIPAAYRGADLSRAPILWHTGFHGPAVYRPSTTSSRGGGYYGGGYGGYGGGK